MKNLVKVFLTILFITTSVTSYMRKDCICGIENSGYLLSSPVESRFAWMAALKTRLGEAFCAGALISDQLVLTAGSCVILE